MDNSLRQSPVRKGKSSIKSYVRTSSNISKNFYNNTSKEFDISLSSSNYGNNKDLIDKYIQLKKIVKKASDKRSKSFDLKKNSNYDYVTYLNRILTKNRKGENETKSTIFKKENPDKETIKLINSFDQTKEIETGNLNQIDKEKLIDMIVKIRKENSNIYECMNVYINLCKDLASEIIILRNEVDKYKHLSIKN